MKTQYSTKYPWGGFLLTLVGLVMTLLLSACGGTANAAGSPGQTPATSTASSSGLTPTETVSPTPQAANVPSNNGLQTLPLLLKSAQAMQTITSVHIDVMSHGTLQSSGGALPAFPFQQATYTLALHANVALASRQESGKLRLTLKQGQNKTTFALTHVVSGQKLYYKVNTPSVQGNQGTAAPQWMAIDLAALVNQQQASMAGNQMQNLLPLLMQHVAITDKGVAQVKGVQLHHITVVLSQEILDQITANATQPMTQQVLSSIHLLIPLQVDLFINEGTSFLQQAMIKGQMQVNVDRLMGKGPMKQGDVGVPPHILEVHMVTIINFNRYNQPAQIHVPATTGTQP